MQCARVIDEDRKKFYAAYDTTPQGPSDESSTGTVNDKYKPESPRPIL
jgi:hypothetical protein